MEDEVSPLFDDWIKKEPLRIEVVLKDFYQKGKTHEG